MIKYTPFLLIAVFVACSCTDDDMLFNIGNDKIDVKSHIVYVDTFTVKSYTIQIDSIPTSGFSKPVITVGKLNDPQFGTISASSFVKFSVPMLGSMSYYTNFDIPEDAVFDSLKIFLLYNDYFAGDTTVDYTMNVHRLKEKFNPGIDGRFYNNDSIAAMPELLGSVTLKPEPIGGDTLWINLDNSFGEELFTLLDDNSYILKDNDYFYELFRGIMLRWDKSNNAIIGFKFSTDKTSADIPVMRLYYHYQDFSLIRKHFDFKVIPFESAEEDVQFNSFRLFNPLIQLPGSQKIYLPAKESHDVSYVMAGAGIVTRLEIPYLKNLFLMYDNIRILDAQLEIEPAQNSYDDEKFVLPQKLSLFFTDDANRWGNEIFNKNGNAQTPTLVIDEINQEETAYTFDATNFVTSLLNVQTDEVPAMLLTISADDLYQTVNRLVIGSQTNKRNKIKLKVYYMNID